EKLWQAGAVMLGKTNLDEFAMGSSTTTSWYKPTENPWRKPGDNRPLVPGGSSGGSAAAVASHAALGATGTDTGGSIRQPASFCGIVGLKPTYGRCSRWGVVAYASSLDHPGPIARTVRDAAILLGAMAGHDPRDSTSAPLPVPDFEKALTGNVRGLRIGLPKEYRADGMPAEIEALWQQGAQWLREAGAEPVEVSLPMTKYALAAYYIIAPAEASSNLARYDGVKYGLRVAGDSLDEMYELTRAEGFGAEVKRRVLIGTYVLSAGYYDAYYLKAQKVRALIARDFAAAFENVDCLLTPTAPSAAFAIGEKQDDPIAMYLNDVFTVPANLAGLPAISVPAGFGAEPNTQVSPVDAAFPGMLPVLNRHCVEQAVRTGLGLDAQINRESIFARKNYFYPDLPAGYQISQYELPIVGCGKLTLGMPDGSTREIGITRLHLEQDAGKSLHDQHPTQTYVDLNRAGIGLM